MVTDAFKYLVFILLFSSCTKHQEMVDNSLTVGNFICADGSILNPTNYQSSETPPVGVIFWSNRQDSALAVALEDLGYFILADTLAKIESVSGSIEELNGAQNTAALLNFAAKNNAKTPAAGACTKYAPKGVTGWYLPSAGESKLLNKNIAAVNESLTLVGELCQGWYWTSTEDATGDDTAKFFGIVSSIHEGRLISSEKTNTFNVRPIISIR